MTFDGSTGSLDSMWTVGTILVLYAIFEKIQNKKETDEINNRT